jgi:hypothetical protein
MPLLFINGASNFMTDIHPDLNWYTSISSKNNVPPRCPYANVHRCYKYYASLSLFGKVGITTKMEESIKNELDSFWDKSDLIPTITEQDTSISGSDDRKTSFSNFCPEISYERFGLFASSLHRHIDDIDIEQAHKHLARIKATPNDWRWVWAAISPLHYSQCPAYSQLLAINTVPEKIALHEQEIVEFKPGFMGLNINILSLITKFSRWWLSKQK